MFEKILRDGTFHVSQEIRSLTPIEKQMFKEALDFAVKYGNQPLVAQAQMALKQNMHERLLFVKEQGVIVRE
jgi:hypothetical protein